MESQQDSSDDFVSKPKGYKNFECTILRAQEIEQGYVSKYFQNDKIDPEKTTYNTSRKKYVNKKIANRSRKSVAKTRRSINRRKKVDNKNGDEEIITTPQGMCPFCCKLFREKGAARNHANSCAKNMSSDKVEAAMQLLENQIREWEGLGMIYPGFLDGKPKSKLKKNATNDYQGRRKNGKATTQSDDNLCILPRARIPMPKKVKKLRKPIVRKRKTTELKQLPLYTVTEDQKCLIIKERVYRILNADSRGRTKQACIPSSSAVNFIGVPESLAKYHNKESTLWNTAKLMGNLDNKIFNVLDRNNETNSEETKEIVEENTGSSESYQTNNDDSAHEPTWTDLDDEIFLKCMQSQHNTSHNRYVKISQPV